MTVEDSKGRLLAVCIGSGGIPKQAVESAQVQALGLVGDGHRHPKHGGEQRAVCLLSQSSYESLQLDGVSASEPGSYGENLLISGLEVDRLRVGDLLRVGSQLILKVEDIREPCATLKSIDARFPNLMIGRSGQMCSVRQPGTVAPGDSVSVSPK